MGWLLIGDVQFCEDAVDGCAGAGGDGVDQPLMV